MSCENCLRLQEESRQKEEQLLLNFAFLKKKLIGTDNIITQYEKKRKECEAAAKRAEELKKLIDQLSDDLKNREKELSDVFKELQPLRELKVNLERIDKERTESANQVERDLAATKKLNNQLEEALKEAQSQGRGQGERIAVMEKNVSKTQQLKDEVEKLKNNLQKKQQSLKTAEARIKITLRLAVYLTRILSKKQLILSKTESKLRVFVGKYTSSFPAPGRVEEKLLNEIKSFFSGDETFTVGDRLSDVGDDFSQDEDNEDIDRADDEAGQELERLLMNSTTPQGQKRKRTNSSKSASDDERSDMIMPKDDEELDTSGTTSTSSKLRSSDTQTSSSPSPPSPPKLVVSGTLPHASSSAPHPEASVSSAPPQIVAPHPEASVSSAPPQIVAPSPVLSVAPSRVCSRPPSLFSLFVRSHTSPFVPTAAQSFQPKARHLSSDSSPPSSENLESVAGFADSVDDVVTVHGEVDERFFHYTPDLSEHTEKGEEGGERHYRRHRHSAERKATKSRKRFRKSGSEENTLLSSCNAERESRECETSDVKHVNPSSLVPTSSGLSLYDPLSSASSSSSLISYRKEEQQKADIESKMELEVRRIFRKMGKFVVPVSPLPNDNERFIDGQKMEPPALLDLVTPSKLREEEQELQQQQQQESCEEIPIPETMQCLPPPPSSECDLPFFPKDQDSQRSWFESTKTYPKVKPENVPCLSSADSNLRPISEYTGSTGEEGRSVSVESGRKSSSSSVVDFVNKTTVDEKATLPSPIDENSTDWDYVVSATDSSGDDDGGDAGGVDDNDDRGDDSAVETLREDKLEGQREDSLENEREEKLSLEAEASNEDFPGFPKKKKRVSWKDEVRTEEDNQSMVVLRSKIETLFDSNKREVPNKYLANEITNFTSLSDEVDGAKIAKDQKIREDQLHHHLQLCDIENQSDEASKQVLNDGNNKENILNEFVCESIIKAVSKESAAKQLTSKESTSKQTAKQDKKIEYSSVDKADNLFEGDRNPVGDGRMDDPCSKVIDKQNGNPGNSRVTRRTRLKRNCKPVHVDPVTCSIPFIPVRVSQRTRVVRPRKTKEVNSPPNESRGHVITNVLSSISDNSGEVIDLLNPTLPVVLSVIDGDGCVDAIHALKDEIYDNKANDGRVGGKKDDCKGNCDDFEVNRGINVDGGVNLESDSVNSFSASTVNCQIIPRVGSRSSCERLETVVKKSGITDESSVKATAVKLSQNSMQSTATEKGFVSSVTPVLPLAAYVTVSVDPPVQTRLPEVSGRPLANTESKMDDSDASLDSRCDSIACGVRKRHATSKFMPLRQRNKMAPFSVTLTPILNSLSLSNIPSNGSPESERLVSQKLVSEYRDQAVKAEASSTASTAVSRLLSSSSSVSVLGASGASVSLSVIPPTSVSVGSKSNNSTMSTDESASEDKSSSSPVWPLKRVRVSHVRTACGAREESTVEKLLPPSPSKLSCEPRITLTQSVVDSNASSTSKSTVTEKFVYVKESNPIPKSTTYKPSLSLQKARSRTVTRKYVYTDDDNGGESNDQALTVESSLTSSRLEKKVRLANDVSRQLVKRTKKSSSSGYRSLESCLSLNRAVDSNSVQNGNSEQENDRLTSDVTNGVIVDLTDVVTSEVDSVPDIPSSSIGAGSVVVSVSKQSAPVVIATPDIIEGEDYDVSRSIVTMDELNLLTPPNSNSSNGAFVGESLDDVMSDEARQISVTRWACIDSVYRCRFGRPPACLSEMNRNLRENISKLVAQVSRNTAAKFNGFLYRGDAALTKTEQRIVDLVLCGSEGDKMKKRNAVFELTLSLMHSKDVTVLGKYALARLYTAICFKVKDLEKPRVLCYDLIYAGTEQTCKIVSSIVATWDEVLSYESGSSHLLDVMKYLLVKELSLGSCSELKKLMSLKEGQQNKTKKELVEELMENLNSAVYESDVDEIVRAVVLVAKLSGWEWTNDFIIHDLVWPTLQEWAKSLPDVSVEFEETGPRDQMAAYVIKLLGFLCIRCPKKNKDVALRIMTTMQSLLQTAKKVNVAMCVQHASIEVLFLLKRFNKDIFETTVKDWRSTATNITPWIELLLRNAKLL